MKPRLLISLFDFTGNWSKPYRDAGYEVVQVDLKHGRDVMKFTPAARPWGVLAAPPCNIWTCAASWRFKEIAPGHALYEEQKALILRAVEICRSAERFWVLENPRGRLSSVIGEEHTYEFQPSDFGDPWSKRTCLWGRFEPPIKRQVLQTTSRVGGGRRAREYPLWGTRISNRGSDVLPKSFRKVDPEWMEQRRTFRSATPPGFARAFFEANP